MRIAVDCRPIQGEYTGVGRYLMNVLKHWQQSPRKHDYFLYFDDEDQPQFSSNRFHQRTLSFSSFLFDNVSVPYRILRDDIDVFWSQFKSPVIFPPTAARVVTIHDLAWLHYTDEWSLRYRLSPALLRLTVALSEAIFTVSEYSKEEIVETYDLKKSVVTVTPNATQSRPDVTIGFSDFVNRYGLSTPYILYIGTLYPRRHPEALVQAFRDLRTIHPEVSLFIVGELRHPEYESFEELLSAVGVSELVADDIHYETFIPESDLIAAYEYATAFIYVSEYEGFGIPPLEAMAHGTPVVTANCRPLVDIFGDAGLIVDPEDGDGIREALRALIEDEAVRSQCIEAGYDIVERHSWERSADIILDTIESLE